MQIQTYDNDNDKDINKDIRYRKNADILNRQRYRCRYRLGRRERYKYK